MLTQKLVIVPVGALLLIAALLLMGPAMQAMTTTTTYSVAQQSSAALAVYETASIEVAWFETLPTEGWRELKPDDNPGPEGKPPRLPNLKDPFKIWILEEATRKVIELRDSAGNVLARVTWTFSNLTNFIDDWTGPKWGWSSKVEVAKGFGGNGLGLWLWQLAERIFYQPGMVRVVIDMSKTQSGQTGWTSYFLPQVWEFIRTYVGQFQVLYENNTDKIWIIQYAP